MKEYGTAVSIQDGRVTVAMKRTAACEKCGRCTHPHIAFGDNTDLYIEAVPSGDIRPGDTVMVEMESREFLAASFLVWGLPIVAGAVGLGAGLMLGNAMGNPGLWGGTLGFGAVAGSFFWLHLYDKSSQGTGRYLPIATPLRNEEFE